MSDTPEPGPETTADWAEEAVRQAEAQEHLNPSHGDPGQDHRTREEQVLDRIDAARRRAPKLKEERITLAHGSGGKATSTLIEALFLPEFRNEHLEPLNDHAVLDVGAGQRIAFTTDSFVVKPLFFPGGDIGDLAVNGTVNDLAVSGAEPRYLSAGFILEEGFATEDLRRIVGSMKRAAAAAGVHIVTGDTKVIERGSGDGCYINTAGVGVLTRDPLPGPASVQPGDRVLVSGPIGDHGITVMLARGDLDIQSDVTSDTAPLHEIVRAVLDAAPGTRCMRDATRGGVATVVNEIARDADVAVVVDEREVPVQPVVHGACEILGIDPLYVACEGRLVAFVPADEADAALAAMHAHPLGKGAAIIGAVKDDPPGLVLLKTEFGGTRIVDVLVGDPLPRIC